jgi:hypothetical protein
MQSRTFFGYYWFYGYFSNAKEGLLMRDSRLTA